ncbi:MAG: hypothetical protein HRT46_12280 [Deltaproteobacteria bacterium]|nr:hypothetical protein [Deltaproteobacteria bacterium]
MAHEETNAAATPTYPRVAVAEAIRQYRERLPSLEHVMSSGISDIVLQSDPSSSFPGAPDFPNYSDRSGRGDRGFASIGELLLLTQPEFDIANEVEYQDQYTQEELAERRWRIDHGALEGAWGFGPIDDELGAMSMRISTDMNHLPDSVNDADNLPEPDDVAADAEEANLLFGGISNLVTTRSDVFTVYFKIRSFRQNSVGIWDATDREYIVDESRYVMLVDRSEVNTPLDRPKILYLEKLPN